jgi:hypothetical protein
MLDSLERALINVRDQTYGDLPNVIRVAAQAGLLLIEKYFTLTEECELYQIAIGMLTIYFPVKVISLNVLY